MIVLAPIGEVEEASLEALKQALAEIFHQRVEIGDGIALTRESWNQRRDQHLASMLLAELPSLRYAIQAIEFSGWLTLISLLPDLILFLDRQKLLRRERSYPCSA